MDDLQNQEVQKENPPDRQQCLNCGSDLAGRFCSECGQDSRPFQRSLISIIGNAAEGLFDVDGKVLRSVLPLLTSPGKLTLDYLKGKRRSQVNPFQLYAFFSFIFFLAAFSGSNDGKKNANSENGNIADTSSFSVQVQKACSKIFRQNRIKGLVFEYDSLQSSLPSGERDNQAARYFRRNMRAFADKLSSDENLVDDLLSNMQANIPNTLILMLPIFALILKLLYLRRPFFFIDHLVFSIHIFCFFFITGMIFWLFEWAWPDSVGPILLLAIPVYPLWAMKKIFQQSWTKTFLKFSISSVAFSILAISSLVFNFLITVFFQM